jgi:hypothetical protein
MKEDEGGMLSFALLIYMKGMVSYESIYKVCTRRLKVLQWLCVG